MKAILMLKVIVFVFQSVLRDAIAIIDAVTLSDAITVRDANN